MIWIIVLSIDYSINQIHNNLYNEKNIYEDTNTEILIITLFPDKVQK